MHNFSYFRVIVIIATFYKVVLNVLHTHSQLTMNNVLRKYTLFPCPFCMQENRLRSQVTPLVFVGS